MLNAINTKILLAILAALTVIGGAVLYQRDQAEKAAAAAAKAAAILQLQQQKRVPEAEGTRRSISEDRSRRTRNGTIPPQPMKARPGRRTFPSRSPMNQREHPPCLPLCC